MALFGQLPDELFKPLASPNRRMYGELLLSLHEKTFGVAAEAPRRADAIHEVGDFLARWEAVNGVSEEDDPKTPREERARAVYQRLVDTGWMIEHKERYVRRVDLDPDASGLLHALSAINRGEARTYGGAVISVLSALENAAANPSERSENVRNAIVASRDFLAHMRMVSVSLRKVEEKIVRQDNLRDIFRSFFVDFVEKHLVADFKTLHTKNNPFRFRSRIIQQARAISGSALTVMALGEAYHREGRAPSAALGQVAVLDDLAVVVEVFESTEAHLAAIDATAARIERRIMTTARYMDRVGRTSEALLLDALKALAAAPEKPGGFRSALLPTSVPLGPPHMALPRKERPPIPESAVRKPVRDAGFERYLEAKSAFLARTKVTAEGFLAYLEREVGRRAELRGSEMRIVTVDDFFVFQRLRELPTIFGGHAARRFQIEMLPARVTNEWIDCQDFVVRRRKHGGVDAAA
jgi:hypothetical protein